MEFLLALQYFVFRTFEKSFDIFHMTDDNQGGQGKSNDDERPKVGKMPVLKRKDRRDQ